MVRSIFCSIGLFVFLWGAAFLMVDKLVLDMDAKSDREEGFRGMFITVNDNRERLIDPPDWAAFSLMSVGSVTMLYAVALPKRQ